MDELSDFRIETADRRRYRSLRERAEFERATELPCGDLHDDLPTGADSMEMPVDAMSRRRFLSLLSASATLALGASGCSRIDRGTIVPYTKRPAEGIPGVATFYASTFQEGLITQGILVKTREGRPIHLEGNGEHAVTRGKTSLRAVADVLGLYDPDRLRQPRLEGSPTTWERAGKEIAQALGEARAGGKAMLLLTDVVASPSKRALIADLKKALPALRHAAWEPAASQAELAAARALYGEAALPHLHLERASAILALESDFLGVDANTPAPIHGFSGRRRISGPAETMNRLWVIEGCMSLTGANADQRIQVRPSRSAALAFALARFLHDAYDLPLPPGMRAEILNSFDLDTEARSCGIEPGILRSLAEDLKRAGRSALVITGPALPPQAHIAGHLLNAMLGAEGHTVDASYAAMAPDVLSHSGLLDLLKEAAEGAFSVAVFWGTNPAYAFPQSSAWKAAAAKIPMKVRIGLYEDETALDCQWRLPEHHWLEAWGDFEPSTALLSLRQPAIGALYDTRQGEDILISWLQSLGSAIARSYPEYLKNRWQKEIYTAGSPVPFQTFWNASLHDGVLRREVSPHPPRVLQADALREAMSAASAGKGADATDELELVLRPGAALYDGRYANNGWLNELPDPVTKATWGNPILLSIADAARLSLADEDVVKVTAGTESVEVPVIIQPGQARGVASLALGYGRRTGNVAAGVGANAYPLVDIPSVSPYLRGSVKIVRTGKRLAVPRTQEHFRMEGRDLARSRTFAEFTRQIGGEAAKAEHEPASLVPAQQFPSHKWGMVIDLSACVGCSACVLACQSENNIPVVGPEQVQRGREMHWLRIDRYYEGDPAHPTVIHQPVLCQHCDHAPCEIVCPVNATTHSADGLNQMSYNRCVGTRYCSNNCPFKVRRFNFFDYTSMKKEPESLVFNPEVTVRPRGVMEKCSFCVQRIEDAKQVAKAEGRDIKDGEIKPACAVACPAEAIVFGDLNNLQSDAARLSKTNRAYRMLEELGIRPAVTYLADISNRVSGKGRT